MAGFASSLKVLKVLVACLWHKVAREKTPSLPPQKREEVLERGQAGLVIKKLFVFSMIANIEFCCGGMK